MRYFPTKLSGYNAQNKCLAYGGYGVQEFSQAKHDFNQGKQGVVNFPFQLLLINNCPVRWAPALLLAEPAIFRTGKECQLYQQRLVHRVVPQRQLRLCLDEFWRQHSGNQDFPLLNGTQLSSFTSWAPNFPNTVFGQYVATYNGWWENDRGNQVFICQFDAYDTDNYPVALSYRANS